MEEFACHGIRHEWLCTHCGSYTPLAGTAALACASRMRMTKGGDRLPMVELGMGLSVLQSPEW